MSRLSALLVQQYPFHLFGEDGALVELMESRHAQALVANPSAPASVVERALAGEDVSLAISAVRIHPLSDAARARFVDDETRPEVIEEAATHQHFSPDEVAALIEHVRGSGRSHTIGILLRAGAWHGLTGDPRVVDWVSLADTESRLYLMALYPAGTFGAYEQTWWRRAAHLADARVRPAVALVLRRRSDLWPLVIADGGMAVRRDLATQVAFTDPVQWRALAGLDEDPGGTQWVDRYVRVARILERREDGDPRVREEIRAALARAGKRRGAPGPRRAALTPPHDLDEIGELLAATLRSPLVEPGSALTEFGARCDGSHDGLGVADDAPCGRYGCTREEPDVGAMLVEAALSREGVGLLGRRHGAPTRTARWVVEHARADTHYWSVLLALAESWEGTLEGLLETTEALVVR